MSDSIGPTDSDAEPLPSTAPAPMHRRSFLVWAAGASLGASALFIGATAIQAMVPPARSIDGRTNPGKLPVARLSDLKTGQPLLAEYGEDAIFVVKMSANVVVVYDAACPHVRCRLLFNDKTAQFDCPCHKSTFGIDGVRLSGPARRNMILAQSEVVDGQVIVSGFRT